MARAARPLDAQRMAGDSDDRRDPGWNDRVRGVGDRRGDLGDHRPLLSPIGARATSARSLLPEVAADRGGREDEHHGHRRAKAPEEVGLPVDDDDRDPGADGEEHLEDRGHRPRPAPTATGAARCDGGENGEEEDGGRREANRDGPVEVGVRAGRLELAGEHAEEDRHDQPSGRLDQEEDSENADHRRSRGGAGAGGGRRKGTHAEGAYRIGAAASAASASSCRASIARASAIASSRTASGSRISTDPPRPTRRPGTSSGQSAVRRKVVHPAGASGSSIRSASRTTRSPTTSIRRPSAPFSSRMVTATRGMSRSYAAADSVQWRARSNSAGRPNVSPVGCTARIRRARYVRISSSAAATTYQTPAFRTSPSGSMTRSTADSPRR